jgi:DNA-binding MarR family transcriptional regulator
MTAQHSSNVFTTFSQDAAVGPPLIGALLRRPLETVRRHMLDRLHEHGFTDLEPSHLIVLQYPGPHGMRPSELAVRLQISKQALNYQLGQLERLGYLERGPDPDDMRSKRIVLTPRAESAVPVIREAVAEVETAWGHLLGADSFARLRDLLVELNSLIPD